MHIESQGCKWKLQPFDFKISSKLPRKYNIIKLELVLTTFHSESLTNERRSKGCMYHLQHFDIETVGQKFGNI